MASPFISVRLVGGKKAAAELRALAARSPGLVSAALFTSALFILVPRMKAKLRENRSVFTGETLQKTTARSGVSANVLQPFVDVGSIGVPYSLNLERGQGPHEPNPEVVKEYVQKKMGLDGDSANNVTASIIKTLQAAGAKPHPFVEPVFEASKGEFVIDVVSRIKSKIVFRRGKF